MASVPPCYQPLDNQQCQILAQYLQETDESPETVMPIHLLRHDLCQAYLAGTPEQIDGLVIQEVNYPGDIIAFGSSATTLWHLIQSTRLDWQCISVSPACASSLAVLLETHEDGTITYYDDVYSTLTQPVRVIRPPSVRLLTLDDLPLFEMSDEKFRLSRFGDITTLLKEGIVAAALLDGQIVARAITGGRSRHYADIAITTLEGQRGQGLATATASLVIEQVQQAGLIPVWCSGSDNTASLRVAQKLGFTEVSRRTYIIPTPLAPELVHPQDTEEPQEFYFDHSW